MLSTRRRINSLQSHSAIIHPFPRGRSRRRTSGACPDEAMNSEDSGHMERSPGGAAKTLLQ
eukprot:8591876-Pyramimonas_sp.AAC.1